MWTRGQVKWNSVSKSTIILTKRLQKKRLPTGVDTHVNIMA